MMALLVGFFFFVRNIDTLRGLPALMIACKLVPNKDCPFFGNCSKSGNRSYFCLLFTALMYLHRCLIGAGFHPLRSIFHIKNWSDLLLTALANLDQV
jgi:hypothetical protein